MIVLIKSTQINGAQTIVLIELMQINGVQTVVLIELMQIKVARNNCPNLIQNTQLAIIIKDA